MPVSGSRFRGFPKLANSVNGEQFNCVNIRAAKYSKSEAEFYLETVKMLNAHDCNINSRLFSY